MGASAWCSLGCARPGFATVFSGCRRFQSCRRLFLLAAEILAERKAAEILAGRRFQVYTYIYIYVYVHTHVYIYVYMSQPQNYQRPLYQRRFIQYCFFLHFPWRTIGDSQKTIPLNMVCAGPSSWSCRSLTCVPCLY